ncbi:MAG: type IV secretion system protein [Pseudomonadota bacterium]
MKIKLLPHNFKNLSVALILTASLLFSALQNTFAAPDYVRTTTIDSQGSCKTQPLDFGPMGSKDQEWEIDNPSCIAYIGVIGASVFATRIAASAGCNQLAQIALISASSASGVVLSPKVVTETVKNAGMCATFMAAQSYVQAAACCSGAASMAAAVGVATSELAIIWQVAVDSQRDAHLCGETWNTWQERPAAQQNANDGAGIPDYQDGSLPNNTMYIHGKGDLSDQKRLEDKYKSGAMTLDITNQEYREYIYGGIEKEDKGGDDCENPASWSDETKDMILGYHSKNQRYYMRGPNMASNYACGRFLLHKGTAQEKNDAKTAYECCKKRSQETMCIEEGGNYAFCKIGGRCRVRNVWYSIHEAKSVPNYICATTYSVCPYNHNMGGGTEIAQYDDKYKILLNHCQYLKHCSKRPDVPYIRTSDLDGAWISSACFDLKGDSQNEYQYDGPLTPLNKTRNFSAPIAQCFKETLENIFINKAGNTKCLSPDEEPDQDGNCKSGYFYKAGEVVAGQASFFQTIQDNLQTAIKLVMTMAVTVAGIAVLLSGNPWDKKTIIMFIVKLGLVAYFALGTAWQDYFFRGVSSASTDLAQIFMKIDQGVVLDQNNNGLISNDELMAYNADSSNRDGCQFPRYNYAFVDGVTQGDKYDPLLASYPLGKEYLQIWDMLDCKIARSLGFGPEVSVPNLIIMILAGLISNGLGMVFFVATFAFAFYLIALTVRALHIFLISSMAITIMIYISPITITACLFKKTESIFKSWRTNLLSFVLQPVILFAYLGILITIFEHTMIGDAKFIGDGKANPKRIDCSSGNAGNNSIYCIFQFNNVQTNNALSPIGISLPVLFNMNQAKLNTIMKAALLMFIFTKFLDKIGELAEKLLGGVELKSGSKGAAESLAKAFGISKAITSRGSRGTKKWGGKLAGKVGGFVKSKVSGYNSARNQRDSSNKDSGDSQEK